MFGMETMSEAVSGLGNIPAFQNLFILFKNPILGVLAGAILTAIIQSSSASVGILQALAVTGRVSYGAAIPIIMGQNIGTCVTAILSSVGANKNAKRAAMVHLSFNVIGTTIWLAVFCVVKTVFSPIILNESASLFGIAVAHSAFNILCTVLMLPLTNFLEKLVTKLIPDAKKQEGKTELDERLLATPSIALERCHEVAADMAKTAVSALADGLTSLHEYTPEFAETIRKEEDITDHYEDMLGTYLVHLSSKQISEQDSTEAAKLLKIIGDYERIADHGVNLLDSAEEMQEKNVALSETAKAELKVITAAVREILDLSLTAFLNDDIQAAKKVEPLEQVIDTLKEKLRTSHILRMQQGRCSIDAGFIWSDVLTNLERTSDHCSNIAGCVIDIMHHNMNIHESLRVFKNDSDDFRKQFEEYSKKYALNILQ